MSEDFKIWWHNEGSGMPPFKEEETCDHVERVSAIAWSNGAFKATLSLEVENARLQAEIERLRKAGDELSIALAAFHLIHRGKIDTTTQPDIVAWNAAKEGKPSV